MAEETLSPEASAYYWRKANFLRDYFLPKDLLGEFDRYVLDRDPPGGFVQSCLENDLKGAFGYADILNRSLMFNIVSYIVNVLPNSSQGSPALVEAWLEGGPKRG